MPRTRAQHRRRDERGVAMVEFAFVGVILAMFAFGIIVFGFLLSFKQDVTRAAAEGARVGAVAQPPAIQPATMYDDDRYLATMTATEDAVRGFDQECGVGGMTCTVTIHDCANPALTDPAVYWTSTACVTVHLEYDYATFPVIIDPPLLSAAMPETISSSSVARLNQ